MRLITGKRPIIQVVKVMLLTVGIKEVICTTCVGFRGGFFVGAF